MTSDHTEASARIQMWGATPDSVIAAPLSDGNCYVDIKAGNVVVTLFGDIADLRAVAVEIDRQLAHLEVAHLIDQATDGGEG